MLRDRLISAAAAIAILVPTIAFAGVIGVSILVGLVSCIAVRELSRNLPALNARPSRELTIAFGLLLVAAFHLLPVTGVLATVVLFPLIVLVTHLLLYNSIERTIESSSQMILVSVYVVVPLAHAIVLRRLDGGMAWVFFVLVVISFGDVAAYFIGKYYGKRQFSKRVSPRKTIEGLAGGVGGNLFGMLVMKIVFPSLPPLSVLIPVTLLLAVVGPLGDLVASALKRRLEIKDFGSLMRGHGGVLDRADALIPSFPTVYYFLILSGSAVPS
jgi:phosphatidate cytidylyltransferase